MDTVRSPRLVLCVLCTPYSTHTDIFLLVLGERERASQAAQELETPNVQIYQIPFSLSLYFFFFFVVVDVLFKDQKDKKKKKKKNVYKMAIDSYIVLYKDEDWLLRNGKISTD